MRRTLALKKDTLAELASDDLRDVVGGSAGTCYTCVQCVVRRITEAIAPLPPLPSIDTPCS